MVDDFHNEREWAIFMEGIRQMRVSAEVEELGNDASPFHVVFDMKERIRVSGANGVHGDGIVRGGTVPH